VKIERSMHNDIPLADLFEMICTEAYQERKCVDVGALSYEVSVVRADDGAVITLRRTLPSDGFPSLLRGFVPSGLNFTETNTWGPAAADGSRSAGLHLEFHGSPLSMEGTIRMVADGAKRSTVLVAAEFKAHVPLIGGKVERSAAPIVIGVIDAEDATAKAWVAGSR
jgi:Protein of unknown function (DUF2505)